MVQSPDRCLIPLIQDQAALGRGPETHSHVAADSTRLSGRCDACPQWALWGLPPRWAIGGGMTASPVHAALRCIGRAQRLTVVVGP